MTKHCLARAAVAVLAVASLGACTNTASVKPAVDTAKIAAAVKADEDQLTLDFNAHDVGKVVGHDAPDVVQMFHGFPNFVGLAGDTTNNQQFFAANPNGHFALADAVVDVAASGDMAVYRATYVLTFTDPKTKAPATEHGNYLAGYKQQADGSWKMAWSIGADMPAPTPAAKS